MAERVHGQSGPLFIGIDPGAPGGDMTAVQVGPHRLYCADAYQLRETLGVFDAECMDPPYRFDNSGGGKYRKERQGSDQIVAEGLDQGFDHAIINPLRHGSLVVFCHNDQLPELLAYIKPRYQRFCVLEWIKKNPQPVRNKHYLPDTEFFIHAWNSGFHPVGEHHDMHRWVSAGTMPARVFGHGTVKPLDVMNKVVRNLQGRTLIDPFMGTGSTGVAAIRQGKVFTGIEHNPKHFATAVDRITAAYKEQQHG